ncbi:hypothetical protein BDW22DRAFT_1313653, partial [Trametopsis cervina]
DRTNDVRKYELTDEEWEVARQLRDVLEIFLDATLYFSTGEPTIADIIPAMDLLDEKLATDSLNKSYKPCIRAALNLGKQMINKYYDKTDSSEIYRIAMMLHPSYKLSYFREHNWEPEWIKTA